MSNDGRCTAKCRSPKQDTLFKSVHCSSSLHLALLEGNHITRDYWKKGFVGIMSSCYCLYYLQCSEQTMLLKKWRQALPHLCIATAELKRHVHFLAFWWEALDQLCLASALFAWQRVHPDELRQVVGCRTESPAGGCWGYGVCSGYLDLLDWNLLSTWCQGVRSSESSYVW